MHISKQGLLLAAITLSCVFPSLWQAVEACGGGGGGRMMKGKPMKGKMMKGGLGKEPFKKGKKVKGVMSTGGGYHNWDDAPRVSYGRPQVVERIRYIETPVYVQRPAPRYYPNVELHPHDSYNSRYAEGNQPHIRDLYHHHHHHGSQRSHPSRYVDRLPGYLHDMH